MKIEQHAFPASTQTSPNRLKAAVRWILSFSFFIAIFAVLITLISYGFIRLRGTEQKPAVASSSGAASAAIQPSSPEPPALPSGATGHVAGNQTQSASQATVPRSGKTQ